MPTKKGSTLVKIQRNEFSVGFQVTRALLTAASAVVQSDPRRAVSFLDNAIKEMTTMRNQLAIRLTGGGR